jgi:hypothetical protein
MSGPQWRISLKIPEWRRIGTPSPADWAWIRRPLIVS